MAWVVVGSVIVAGGEQIIANQQRQKAKGQAGAIEAESKAEQDAADAKLAQEHQQNLLAQSQAGLVARNAIARPLARSASLMSPPQPLPRTSPAAAPSTGAPLPAPVPNPLAIQPNQGSAKTLLGQ